MYIYIYCKKESFVTNEKSFKPKWEHVIMGRFSVQSPN